MSFAFANCITQLTFCQWVRSEKLIQTASPNGDEMLLNGKAPRPGQVMKLTNLAKTLRSVAEHGKDGFYKGRVAEAIVELIQSKGGVMSLEDLANHRTDFVEPLKYTYKGEVTVYECPPNGQGTRFNYQSFIESIKNRMMRRNNGSYSSWHPRQYREAGEDQIAVGDGAQLGGVPSCTS